MPAVFVLIWSTGFIVAKFGLPYAPPLTFLAIRYLLSIACFLVWIVLAGAAWPRGRRQWLHLAVTGVLMHAAYLGGVWVAVKGGMGSGLTALIVGLQPVLTALWVSWAGSANDSAQPKVTPRQWLGLVLGLGGLLLVVARKFGTGSEVTALTLGCAVFALFSITAGTLYQKRFVQPTDVRSANAIQLGAALLVSLPFALLESEAIVWNPQFMGSMAWSVLALTLGGSSLLYLLIQRGAATSVTSLLYLVPPTTAIMAWLLFAEPITLATIVGTALTALGVSLVVRPAKPRAA
ncbi:Permease of the drug/metabolite transporter (DMT) superfamily [Polaromonas sp. OV174]|uniref:DMT family transporter n=1 Tax=Polaromonas sp. OV174 TaxID=1855300 RepID=UPI0008F290D6|nr:DMT family transporter [Polaromonas sp. OV174]SFC54576.1 Permease of the drug/metabolite transporter (DMT) superfamily [Polaromonas sp. OV174]